MWYSYQQMNILSLYHLQNQRLNEIRREKKRKVKPKNKKKQTDFLYFSNKPTNLIHIIYYITKPCLLIIHLAWVIIFFSTRALRYSLHLTINIYLLLFLYMQQLMQNHTRWLLALSMLFAYPRVIRHACMVYTSDTLVFSHGRWCYNPNENYTKTHTLLYIFTLYYIPPTP